MCTPSGMQPEPGKFARATTDEINMSMARHRISDAQLALKTSRSQSYLSKRLRNEVPFSANDIEEICKALDEDLLGLMVAAVRAAGLGSPAAGHDPDNEKGAHPQDEDGAFMGAKFVANGNTGRNGWDAGGQEPRVCADYRSI